MDSILGALLQATPYSKLEKKVVELPGGRQAVESKNIIHIGGWDILDNNQVSYFPRADSLPPCLHSASQRCTFLETAIDGRLILR